MLEIDPAAAHYEIDAQRIDLVEEFRRAPRGPHSDELQRVLHRMRWAGEDHRYCAVVVEPGRKWMLVVFRRSGGVPWKSSPTKFSSRQLRSNGKYFAGVGRL
jgi:hypothetical protein